jgi:hypothetical protein
MTDRVDMASKSDITSREISAPTRQPGFALPPVFLALSCVGATILGGHFGDPVKT